MPFFAELNHCLKAWIDDLALYKPTYEQILPALKRFFTICRGKNVKFSARKSDMFLTELKWRGRIIPHKSVELYPGNASGL